MTSWNSFKLSGVGGPTRYRALRRLAPVESWAGDGSLKTGATTRMAMNSKRRQKTGVVEGPVLLIPVNAERGQRVQVCCRMIADEVDGPRTYEHERSDHRDDGGADHDLAPFISSGGFPPCAAHQIKLRSPTTTFRMMSFWRIIYVCGRICRSKRGHNLVKCAVTVVTMEPNQCFKMFTVETLH